jgi:hypothetical protein
VTLVFWFHDINNQVIYTIGNASSTEALLFIEYAVNEANVVQISEVVTLVIGILAGGLIGVFFRNGMPKIPGFICKSWIFCFRYYSGQCLSCLLLITSR